MLMNTRSIVSIGLAAKILLTTLPFALALAPCARATVTNIAYYRFGENDPGAVNGGAAAGTTNIVGGQMNLVGSPVYTNNIAASAASAVGSTLALQFASGKYGTNALLSTLVNNFGIELWVKPDATNTTQCLAYNGNTGGAGSGGWGLYIISGQYSALFGGVAIFPASGAPASTNVWAHIALVRNNGTNIFFLNGAPVVTNTVSTPAVPSGRFAVAAQPQSLTTEFFAGALDEVRVFTFAPGTFSTNDLLVINGQPPVATTTAATGI